MSTAIIRLICACDTLTSFVLNTIGLFLQDSFTSSRGLFFVQQLFALRVGEVNMSFVLNFNAYLRQHLRKGSIG